VCRQKASLQAVYAHTVCRQTGKGSGGHRGIQDTGICPDIQGGGRRTGPEGRQACFSHFISPARSSSGTSDTMLASVRSGGGTRHLCVNSCVLEIIPN
jgi:hypothetical protein